MPTRFEPDVFFLQRDRSIIESRLQVFISLNKMHHHLSKALWNASDSPELVEVPLNTRSYYANDFYQRLLTIKSALDDAMTELLKMNGEKKDETESTAGNTTEL